MSALPVAIRSIGRFLNFVKPEFDQFSPDESRGFLLLSMWRKFQAR